jgi:hypothetical protein
VGQQIGNRKHLLEKNETFCSAACGVMTMVNGHGFSANAFVSSVHSTSALSAGKQ